MICINTLSVNIGSLWGAVWPYLIAVLLFGVIITIHELGHFTFAKLFKVKVNEFALGMGPTLFKKKFGETTYALRLFPIGGFVSMEGEEEASEADGAFNKKPAWQRFIIVAAGAVLNLILGVIVVAVTLSGQGIVGSRTVHSFLDNAVSQQSGLKVGDEIVKIDSTPVYSYRGIGFNLIRGNDNKVDMTVIRDGKKIVLKDVTFNQFEFEGKQYIEQDFKIVGYDPTFGNVLKNSILDSASIVQMVRLSLVDLCTGKYGLKDISGPIGTITTIAESTAEGGESVADKMMTALVLLSYITINVGVFNLLPIPALDGCMLFMLIIEMIRRKPLDQNKVGKVQTIGLVVLLAFMAVVTISDIIKQF